MLAVLFFSQLALKRRFSRKMVNTEDTGVESSISECCRTCLGVENLSPLFPSDETDIKRADELHTVTGLQIKANDGLSQKICDSCTDIINIALKFRKSSRKAEKVLLNNASGRKPKRKNNIKCIKVKEKEVEEAEKIEIEIDETWHEYDEGFHNDEYETAVEHTEEVEQAEPETDETEQNAKPGRRKRMVIPNAPSYKCGTCSKEFRMKATYKAHLRFHTNYCVCETCGKRCRNNNQLQEHKRAKHGLGRIHKCAYCEYSSATKEALTIHERRHTGERPYICDHCGASFHRRSNLVQHIAIHNPDKNFQCDMCPKKLKSRKFLQIHKHNAHTGKRYGYLCPVCDHRFEKPNKCPICQKCEKSRKLLQVHTHKAHRENKYRYVCPSCGDSFTRPGNVRQHLARSHNVPRPLQPTIQRVDM